jgi:hypothetical protein
MAQRIQSGHELIGKAITSFTVSLKKAGDTPTGLVYGRIIDSSNTIKAEIATKDMDSDITTSYANHTFSNTANSYEMADGDRIALYFTQTHSTHRLYWEMATTSELYTNGSYYTGSWTERTRDATITGEYASSTPPPSEEESDPSSGAFPIEHLLYLNTVVPR